MLSSEFFGLSPLLMETWLGQNEQYQLEILLEIVAFYAAVIEARMHLSSTSQTFLSCINLFICYDFHRKQWSSSPHILFPGHPLKSVDGLQMDYLCFNLNAGAVMLQHSTNSYKYLLSRYHQFNEILLWVMEPSSHANPCVYITCIYIYIYIQRERERERELKIVKIDCNVIAERW
jgi:hypothetical protein